MARILVGWTSMRVKLGRSARSGSLLKDLHGLTHFCYSEDQEGCIGVGFSSTVTVVDVDSRVSEPRCATRQLPGTTGKFDLRNFRLCVITALAIQNGLGFIRITSCSPFVNPALRSFIGAKLPKSTPWVIRF